MKLPKQLYNIRQLDKLIEQTFNIDMSLPFSHHPRKDAYLYFVHNLKKLKGLKKLFFTSNVHKLCRQYCILNISELFDLVFGSMKDQGLEIMHLEGCFYHVKETFQPMFEQSKDEDAANYEECSDMEE